MIEDDVTRKPRSQFPKLPELRGHEIRMKRKGPRRAIAASYTTRRQMVGDWLSSADPNPAACQQVRAAKAVKR